MKFRQNCNKQNLGENNLCSQCETYSDAPTPTDTPRSAPLPRLSASFPNSKILIPILTVISVAVIFYVLCLTHIICFNHNWGAPTCIEPAQCSKCDRYKDEKLADHHNWYEYDSRTKCTNCSILREDWLAQQES